MTAEYGKEVIQLAPQLPTSAALTMDWFATNAMYPPRAGIRITPLINGEHTFAAVYDAIESAQHSVEIISWGFDPAMRFKPGGDRIGELLDVRGRHGIKSRVLIWKNPLANFVENTVIGDGLGGSGGSALGSGLGRGRVAPQSGAQNDNEPGGYNTLRGSAAPRYSAEDEQYTREWFSRLHGGRMQNVEFRTRDFSTDALLSAAIRGPQLHREQGRMATLYRLIKGEAPDTRFAHMLMLTLFASHHQKMVLVDYEDGANAVGFVMGHNMHRNYWDTSAHLYDDKAARRSPGFGPWQDLSMKVQGAVLHDLNHNFCSAWDRETFWIKKWFTDGLREQRQDIKPHHFKSAGTSTAQICRTQPQEGAETSILELYRKALGNVRNYVYFENQYFRYPAFAQQLRELAAAYKARGREQDLYVFVVTNNPNDKAFSSTTYATLQELGQEQLMPQAQRSLAEDLLRKRNRLAWLQANPLQDRYLQRGRKNQAEVLEREIAELENKGITPEVEQRLGGLKAQDIAELSKRTSDDGDEQKPYTLRDIPGLKVVIATLTTCTPAPGSTPVPGQQALFRDIYVHSKLLVVDDVFSLLSSANVNARSMHTDSELGLASPDAGVARSWREVLWGAHARESMNDDLGRCDAFSNFVNWSVIMDKNWEQMNKKEPLIAHLTRFWDVETPYAKALD